MKELVIFDVDGTLLKEQSQFLLLKYLLKKKFISVTYFVIILPWFIFYKLGLVKNPKKVVEYAVTFLKDKRIFEIRKIIQTFIHEELYKSFLTEIIDEINLHKSKGRHVLLLSNAIDVLIKEISEYVGAHESIASELEIKDNTYTGKLQGNLIYGTEKLVHIKKYIALKQHLTLETTWVYADHFSDLPILMSVGHPVVVNPGHKLMKIATSNGWKIIRTNFG